MYVFKNSSVTSIPSARLLVGMRMILPRTIIVVYETAISPIFSNLNFTASLSYAEIVESTLLTYFSIFQTRQSSAVTFHSSVVVVFSVCNDALRCMQIRTRMLYEITTYTYIAGSHMTTSPVQIMTCIRACIWAHGPSYSASLVRQFASAATTVLSSCTHTH